MKAMLHCSKVNSSKIQALVAISRETFFSSFASLNSEANMQHYLNTAFSEEKLKQELEDPNSEFYFFETDDILLGYMKLNFNESQIEFKEPDAMEIERIYILQEYQNRQLGTFLLNQAIEMARSKAMRYIWLGVWEKNLKAIAFYQRNGFIEFGQHSFLLGSELQQDLLMKLELH